jgi:hypothetical protein
MVRCFSVIFFFFYPKPHFVMDISFLLGKPRYVEQNKEDGRPFRSTIPAEIVYCEDAESWVFRHEKISTTLGRKDDDKVRENQ